MYGALTKQQWNPSAPHTVSESILEQAGWGKVSLLVSIYFFLAFSPKLRPQISNFHFTMKLFQIGKGVSQGCILSPCLFNLHAEYIMRNARLDEAQAEIKIARKNISNLRYVETPPLWKKAEKN